MNKKGTMNIKPQSDLHNASPQSLIDFYNTLPCTANTGAHIDAISDDLTQVVMTIPYNKNTQNFMGITYGGTMYSATDAVYVVILSYRLGYGYVALDKSATIKYMRPGIEDLTATFNVPNAEIEFIRQELESKRSVTREYPITIIDSKGKSVCKITKEIVIRKSK